MVSKHSDVIVAIVALLTCGCGGSLQVRATVETPPELPIRVFPEVAIVHGTAPEDFDVADALAHHLAASARDGLRVEHVDEDGLERRRANGSFGPASAIIRVDTHVVETARPSFLSRPDTVCTTWGCNTVRRSVVEDLPVVVGRVMLRVSEARTDRLLQELTIEEREEGSDPLSMRMRIVERLRRRVIGAVDPGERQLDVELVDVDDAEVRAALQAVREGHPREALATLERVVSRRTFEQRSDEQRARVMFDLGQARRLAARASGEPDVDSRLEVAERTIRDALMLHPEATFARALTQLREERAARERMRAHRAAASHNFALDRGPAVPPAPPGYSALAPSRPR
ncbi:hypothetical protein [Sandaracinus amylolyticus]|uniref:Uncharacterized protein n=1 Tax=Sandaracinus amylolyticus TaxID=927083 RepID=A0A0F6W3P7_9BACT|nr:hypothetical protein [Sandaracinus amylolyticus]AKF06515.1 hypothetical protein DB32_003664 [Sandaracinus amylolyticus]